jgi:hypothetical protein
LTAILLELKGNRTLLDDLVPCYNVFRFTGGEVPREPWPLVAIASYVEHPFAADRILTGQVERYCDLARQIMELGQTIATGRPWRLRPRWDLARTFAAAAVEVRTASHALEAGLLNLLQELAASPTFSERMHAYGAGEQDGSPSEAVGTT